MTKGHARIDSSDISVAQEIHRVNAICSQECPEERILSIRCGAFFAHIRCDACNPNLQRITYESLNEAFVSCLPRSSQRSDSPYSREFPDEQCCYVSA
jgi:hypothetical protein